MAQEREREDFFQDSLGLMVDSDEEEVDTSQLHGEMDNVENHITQLPESGKEAILHLEGDGMESPTKA